MNGPLSLEDSFRNLARIPLVFNKKKMVLLHFFIPPSPLPPCYWWLIIMKKCGWKLYRSPNPNPRWVRKCNSAKKIQEQLDGATFCFQMQRWWIWRYRQSVCHQFQIYGREFGCPLAMLYHLIYLEKYENHFVTLYVQNLKFKLHCTCRFCCKYQLQYTHVFMGKDWSFASTICVIKYHCLYFFAYIYVYIYIYIYI